MKTQIEKDGVVQTVKDRYLQNFLDRGWTVIGEKKVCKVGKAKATADVIEEEVPLNQEEEDNWTISLDDESSMPIDNEGEE